MDRLNLQTERILNRLTAVEADLRNLRTEHSVTRDLVTALPATVLGAIEKPFASPADRGRGSHLEARK